MAAPCIKGDGPAEDSNYTPYELKELMIEYTIRQQLEKSMELEVDADLNDIAMLDIKELETSGYAAPFLVGPDMYTALEHDLRIFEREAWIRTAMRAIRDEQFMAEIVRMLNEELKQRCIAGQEEARLLQKCVIIGISRLKTALLPPATKLPLPKKPEGHVIEICLTTLRGGHASNPRQEPLFFNPRDPLVAFLSILQSATQMSIIPPVGFRKEVTTSAGPSITSSPSHVSTSFSSPISADSSQKTTHSPSAIAPTPPSSVASRQSRRPKLSYRHFIPRPGSGYTLHQGPWLYRINCDKTQPSEKAAGEIKDENSYRNMLDIYAAEVNRWCSSDDREGEDTHERHENRPRIMIMHSMDRVALTRLREAKAEEAAEEGEYQQYLRDEGFEEDEIGEPFYKFMARDIDYSRESDACNRKLEERSKKIWEKLRAAAVDNPNSMEEKMQMAHDNMMVSERRDAKQALARWATSRGY